MTATFKCSICKDVGFIVTEVDGTVNAEQCECIREEARNKKINVAFKFAEMPEQLKNLKVGDFDTSIYSSEENRVNAIKAKKTVISYIKNFEKAKGTGLYLYSTVKGSGKTRLAVGIGNALMDLYGISVKFSTTTRIIEEIKASFGENHTDYLSAVKAVPVLILDDIGTEKLTDWVNETFYSIINDRMLNGLTTLYTSNCRVDELKHDERIKSRIQGTVYPVQCPEEDIRVELKKNENKDFEKMLGI